MDTLFYKVFHNKYLFCKIFNYIETIEWVVYDNINGYNVHNRKKLKDINSLKWMVYHGQYELLKDKLQNGQQVDISESDDSYSGLVELFKKKQLKNNFKDKEKDEYLLGYFMNIGYYSTGDEDKVLRDNKLHDDNIEIEFQNRKESVINLLIHKRNQLLQINLLATLFENSAISGNQDSIDIDLVKLVIDGPYRLPITEFTLENAIKFSSTTILKVLIDSPNINQMMITTNLKNSSISWSFYNKCRNEMIEFILNNSQLYSLPTQTTSTQTTNPNKKLKVLDGSSSTTVIGQKNIGDCIDENGIIKIKYSFALLTESKSILNKLYELGYLVDDFGSFTPDPSLSNELKLQKSFLHYCNDSGQLQSYFKTYDDSNDFGTNLSCIHRYAISQNSSNALKFLLGNNFKSSNVSGRARKIKLPFMFNSKIPTFTKEFIKYYSIGHKEFETSRPEIQKNIQKYMLSIKSNQEYQNHFQIITKDCNDDHLKLPLKWFDIGRLTIKSRSIIIKDTETIDLIIENNQYINSYFFCIFGIKVVGFNFETLQLVQYALDKYSEVFNKITSEINQIYQYPFSFAIYNCDIDSLMKFKELDLKFKIENGFKSFSVIDPTSLNGLIQWDKVKGLDDMDMDMTHFNFNNQSESSLIKLLDYLNSTGFQYFSKKIFIQFIKCISCSTKLSFNLSNLKINFDKFGIDTTASILFESIRFAISPIELQLVLNNIGVNIGSLFKNDQSQINKKIVHLKHTIDCTLYLPVIGTYQFEPMDSTTLFTPVYELPEISMDGEIKTMIYCTSKYPIQDITECIDILFSCLNKNYINLSIEGIGAISVMVNHLFKRFIRVNGIKLNQVVDLHQSISTRWESTTMTSFTFQHSIYHIFYYLGIKSLKLVKFLLQFPSNHTLFNLEDDDIEFYDEKHYTYCDNFFHYEKNDFFCPTLQYVQGRLDIFKVIDPKIFTFQFINESSFQVLLKFLISNLIYKQKEFYVADNPRCSFDSILSSMLVYLLEIKEFDLFFGHVQFIKDEHPESAALRQQEFIECTKIALNNELSQKLNQLLQ